MKPFSKKSTSKKLFKVSRSLSLSSPRDLPKVYFNLDEEGTYRKLFVVISLNSAKVFQIDDKGSFTLEIEYKDENVEEVYSACTWSLNFLIVGTKNGSIKVLNILEKKLVKELIGHGGAINDLKCHPEDRDLLFSCSNDESIRMWSISSGKTIAIFGGAEGHNSPVLSIDLHDDPNKKEFVTSGEDLSMRIWNYDNNRIEERKNYLKSNSKNKAKCVMVPIPRFQAREIVENNITTCKYIGDSILCTSVKVNSINNKVDFCEMLIWIPTCETDRVFTNSKKSFSNLYQKTLSSSNIKLVTPLLFDSYDGILFGGLQDGNIVMIDEEFKTFVVDLIETNKNESEEKEDENENKNSFIVGISLSKSGNDLIAIYSNGSICRYRR